MKGLRKLMKKEGQEPPEKINPPPVKILPGAGLFLKAWQDLFQSRNYSGMIPTNEVLLYGKLRGFSESQTEQLLRIIPELDEEYFENTKDK